MGHGLGTHKELAEFWRTDGVERRRIVGFRLTGTNAGPGVEVVSSNAGPF